MRSDVNISTPNWRMHVTVGFFSTVIVLVLALLFPGAVTAILLTFAATLAAMGLTSVATRLAKLWYSVQLSRVELASQRQALRSATYQADRSEAERYLFDFPASRRILLPAGADVRLIEALSEASTARADGAAAEPLELERAFVQAGQAYAIIGAQQTGKTFQARHLAALWLARGVTPWVIGPKWDGGEWGGCRLYGGRGDYGAVAAGIEAARGLAEERHADTERGHKAHAPQPIFFDDWTAVVEGCDNARSLIFEASTLFASVNVVLYFIIHADTAAAWGVERKGAALKDGFVKLLILPQYDNAGQVIRSQTRGVVRLASGEERPARLFSGPVPAAGAPLVIDVEPVLDADAERVLALWAAGERSYRRITREVWGQHGGWYNQRVDEILRAAETSA
jgi:hypothetical protein